MTDADLQLTVWILVALMYWPLTLLIVIGGPLVIFFGLRPIIRYLNEKQRRAVREAWEAQNAAARAKRAARSPDSPIK